MNVIKFLSRVVFFFQILVGRLVAAPWANMAWIRCARTWQMCIRSRAKCLGYAIRAKNIVWITGDIKRMVSNVVAWTDCLRRAIFSGSAKLSFVRHVEMAWKESRIPRSHWGEHAEWRSQMWKMWMS